MILISITANSTALLRSANSPNDHHHASMGPVYHSNMFQGSPQLYSFGTIFYTVLAMITLAFFGQPAFSSRPTFML